MKSDDNDCEGDKARATSRSMGVEASEAIDCRPASFALFLFAVIGIARGFRTVRPFSHEATFE